MKQSGFTLLEILVAMLVMAIGLLGLAGLMTSSMRNNLSASHRTQAIWVAYDIVDRMRANRASAVTGGYVTAMGTAANCAPAATSVTATPAQDIAAWKNQLACALPAGNGSITLAGTRATILIQWNDTRGNQGLANQQFKVETQL